MGESWGVRDPLIFSLNWAPKCSKRFLFRETSPALSQGLDEWGPPLFECLDMPMILIIITLKLVYCLRHLERKQTNKNNTKLDHENKGMFESKIKSF